MKKHNKQRLLSRFFIFYFGFCSILLISFLGYFYFFSYNTLIEEANNTLEANIYSLGEQCGYEVLQMDSVSVNLQYSIGARNLLNSLNLDVTDIDRNAFTDLCVTLNGTEGKADLFYLYDFNSNVISVGNYTGVSSYEISQYPWIAQTLDMGGSMFLGTPQTGKNNFSVSSVQTSYISLYRGFFNAHGKQVGALEVAKTCKSIFQPIFAFLSNQKSDIAIYVYNLGGELIFPYDAPVNTLQNYYEVTQNKPENFIYENSESNLSEIIVYHDDNITDWRYIAVQGTATVTEPINELTNMIIIAIIISLIVLAGITYFMSFSLLRPIHALQKSIQNTQLNTLSNTADSFEMNNYIELEKLNNSFQDMRKNLNQSMHELLETRQQEQKSRFLALQSQINPHFFFNTLSSIIVLAEDDKSGDVIKMCRNLTYMMRYISTSDNATVTLKDEIDYVRKYLYCMKVRYQSSLEYIIDIDERLYNESVPRLIIQPIVENALKYGTDTVPPWKILIKGTYDTNCWYIEIEDSGNGFSREALLQIKQRIQTAKNSNGPTVMSVEGMGTLNVYMRWKLFCENDNIFEFGNTKDGHAIVRIGRYIK